MPVEDRHNSVREVRGAGMDRAAVPNEGCLCACGCGRRSDDLATERVEKKVQIRPDTEFFGGQIVRTWA